jgi:hypothetical protein
MSLLSYLATQSFVACYGSGIVLTENTITSKKWLKQVSLNSEQKNVVNIPVINPEKVYLPPLHIKAMDQNGAGFVYFKNTRVGQI